MEDASLACYINNNGQLDLLFAVFDGHGGCEVSIFCKIVFPIVLESNIKHFLKTESNYIEKSLLKSISDIDWILKT